MVLNDVWPTLIAAPFAGSFLGVVIRRLPQRRPVALGRSACESCGATLAPRDLVPLVSYAWLEGRCRHCAAPIGRFHPAVELAALLVAAWAAAAGQGGWPSCLLGWTLLALAWIDLATWTLPDALTLPLLAAGLVATPAAARPDHALAAALAYGGLRLLDLAYRHRRGRSGLGQGDAKLLAAGGAWLGTASLPGVLLIAALAGIAAALARHGRRARGDSAVAFGPSLALAIWLVRLYGSPFG